MKEDSRMRNETVSVVMAAYNAESFIEAAIDSVLAQTYSDFRLYVINDGSTDNTAQILNRYQTHPQCSIFTQNNKGQTASKNRGIVESVGELVAFLDADDMWTPDKLDKQIGLFSNLDIGVTFSRSLSIDEDGNFLKRQPERFDLPRGNVTEELFQRNFLPFSSSIARRTILEEVGGFDESLSMGIDWDLWLRASLQCDIDYVDDATLLYRHWAGQMSNNSDGRFEGTMKIMDKFLDANPGLLPRARINSAYCETHANRAYQLRFLDRDSIGSIREILTALSYKPLDVSAWKIGIRILANRPWT